MVKKAAVAWLALAPSPLMACPACARASADVASLYYIATGLMLLVPILLVSGLIFMIKRSEARRRDQDILQHPTDLDWTQQCS